MCTQLIPAVSVRPALHKFAFFLVDLKVAKVFIQQTLYICKEGKGL